MPPRLTSDRARLSTDEMLQVAETCVWRALAGDADARTTVADIRRELTGRNAAPRWRPVALRLAKSILAQVRLINGSPEFHSVKLLQKFLRYIVKQTLRDQPATQSLIALEVLEKDPDRVGPGAVSSEVARLRTRLSAYYLGSGLADGLRVRIPKGRYIAIISRTLSDTPSHVDLQGAVSPASLQVMPLNGLRGFSAFPAFSPSGHDICFSWNQEHRGYQFDLYMQSIGSTAPTKVTSSAGSADLSPTFSPDGRQIAFLRVSLNRSEIWTASSAAPFTGQKVAEVYATRQEILGRHLAWSRHDDGLVVVHKDAPERPFAIYRVSVATGETTPLTHPPNGIVGDSDPTFSPDGQTLAFVRGEAIGVQDLFLLSVGKDPIRLTFDRKHIFGLCWLPDASGLVLSSNRAGVPSLWKVGLGGEPPERLPGIPDRALHPACSRDGTRLAYTNVVVSTSIWEMPIAETDRNGRTPKRFIYSTRNDVSPSFSADGSKIAFASDRTGGFEIWVCNAAGADPVKITAFESPSGAGTPRWSPDGTQLAFDCRRDGNGQVYVSTLSTGLVRRLTEGPSENVVPAWSHDGRTLYFSSNRTGQHQLYKMSATGEHVEQLTSSGGFAPLESADGRFLYFARGRTAAGLWRINLLTGEEEPYLDLLKPTFWGLWTVVSDGAYSLDSPPEGPPPCVLKFFDGQTSSISDVAILSGLKRVHYQGLAVSPDRRRILYPQLDDSSGEIMIARTL